MPILDATTTSALTAVTQYLFDAPPPPVLIPSSPWLVAALGLVLITNVVMLASERLPTAIRLLAVQGIALGLMPLLLGSPLTWSGITLAVIFLGIKAVALPMMFQRVYNTLPPTPPLPPYMGHNRCVLAGVVGFAFSLWLANHLPPPANPLFLAFFAPAFATILAGLLLLVTRRKALAQVLGYLVMENGIYLLGVPLAHDGAMWLELTILLDIFVGIFIMILAIYHLNQAFDTTDVDKIAALRE
ncbi:NADH-quinone oxidoreductase subunit K [Desulfovibrio cuneatus]|uniref:NADH-quinone oxidoreductase subunit K n=1 Tax=Desulfovibrio cuneatus TaxID=159728 RepID=UPI0004045486|nr:NADH-quinone oxidoreductase subunit K [Desulfovibrio cuneatus]